jgi:protein-tyrosine phosphatase
VIDLHSHLLPGVDDGSRTVAQSARVLRMFVQRGITDVACTPHLLASRMAGGWPANYESAWRQLDAEVPEGIAIHRGAEVMLDRPVPAAAAERKVTLNASRYLLVEFPRLVAANIVARALAEVINVGLVPVLAHPERYSSCTVDVVRAWRDLGSVIQVDATAVGMPRHRGDRARSIVRAGLADILAGDNHGDERSVANALEWLTDNDGADQATLLLETNPRAILDDHQTYEVDPLPARRGLWNGVRRLLGAE